MFEKLKSKFNNPNATSYSSKFGMDTILGKQQYRPTGSAKFDPMDTNMNLVPTSMSDIPIDFNALFNNSSKPSTLKALFDKNISWNTKNGLSAFGKNVGKAVPLVSGGVSALQAASNYSDYDKAIKDNEDLLNAIQVSAMGNPLLSSYLTSDQLNLLNKIRRGNYDIESTAGDFFKNIGGNLDDVLIATALGAVGGVPGMVVSGLGAAANAGIQGLSSGTEKESAELAALYQALMDAEAQYRSMKRPNFTGLGIQQQYQNMYA